MNPYPPPDGQAPFRRAPRDGYPPQPPAPFRPPNRNRTLIAIGVAVVGVIGVALIVAVLLRARIAASRANTPTATSATAPTLRAVVTLPEGQPRGVLRTTPAFDATVAGYVTGGSVVEITKTVTEKSQTWHRVKTAGSPPLNGWMNASILKPQ